MELGSRHSIRDDEVAIEMGKSLRAWRKKKALSMRELGARIRLSHGIICNLENGHGEVSYGVYNRVARYMGWPQYECGRKFSDWAKTEAGIAYVSGKPIPQSALAKPTPKQEDRQQVIPFPQTTPLPEKFLTEMLNSVEELIKFHNAILASLYSMRRTFADLKKGL